GQRWPEAVMHSCGSYFVPFLKRAVILALPGGFQDKKSRMNRQVTALRRTRDVETGLDDCEGLC
ncbi:MAG: hypothetical protein ACNY01_11765, partial [Desulfobacteria bacterium]